MSYYIDTDLKCSNPKVLKAAAVAIQNCGYCYDVVWLAGGTDIISQTRNHTPSDKVIEISKQFPNDVITCRYSFSHDDFSKIFIVDYRNGEEELVDIEPGYMMSIPTFLKNELDIHAIYKKAVAFCRRLDTTETDKDGNLSLNWFEEEVCYKFKYVGTDGKKYGVEVTKNGSHIDFNGFEILDNHNLRKIPKTTNSGELLRGTNGDSPF